MEADVIDCASYQRLRNVKQLGLASLVFPGADYSRFSHGVGACHVAGRMIEAVLQRRPDIEWTKDDYELIQRVRLAALLHDIGHYAFSHATQDAVKEWAKARKVDFFEHEDLGAAIVEQDPNIRAALARHGFADPKAISDIFTRTDPDLKIANLVSSDLDADRLDYLSRTRHFSGLPYGSVDLDYIISQLCEDDEGWPCLTYRALRAADSFLIGRLMDYQQVAFHRAVAGYEWLLKDVVGALLDIPGYDLKLSSEEVVKLIGDGRWAGFTDANLLSRIDNESQKFSDPIVKQKADAMLRRRTPKMVMEWYSLESRAGGTANPYLSLRRSLNGHKPHWAEHFGIHEDLWHVWAQRKQLTKLGSVVSTGAAHEGSANDEEDREFFRQMIRLVREPQTNSTVITDVPWSLSHVLANYDVAIVRVFVLLPPDTPDPKAKAAEIKAVIHKTIEEEEGYKLTP